MHIWRIDGEVTEISWMLQFSQFILGNPLYIVHYNVSVHLKSQRRYHEVSASIARMWQMLCSEYPFYHGNYWQTDWPSTLRYRITSKYSTDTCTFIEQVQTGTVHRFFWKGSQKANCLSVYANEQSDRLLDRTLSDKALPHVTYSQPIQWQVQPISFVRQQTWSEELHILRKLQKSDETHQQVEWFCK
jgi:hypothetical protein